MTVIVSSGSSQHSGLGKPFTDATTKPAKVLLFYSGADSRETVSAWSTAHPEVDGLPMSRSPLTAQCLPRRLGPASAIPELTPDSRIENQQAFVLLDVQRDRLDVGW